MYLVVPTGLVGLVGEIVVSSKVKKVNIIMAK
jgi:hypothetical protein